TMNDQQREFMNKILASVDQMDNLVDNLLDLGRIEAGMGLDLESVDIASLMTEIINGYRPQAANKQITLDVDVAEEMEAINVDPTLLRQAVSNLIDNAIQYTPAEGQVTVKVDQKGEQQLIIVQDTGVGIAPTDQARIFEKFYRARQREGDRQGGLGLGLAIVKSIAEQHGGRIAVESRLGVGSTFTLEIPIRSPLIDEDDANRTSGTNKKG
ncbi:MAG: HAMP domain-containing histidine kinase, partial [Anaerolineales bacterium]|nr:HAMP domain-containing histidine kinase [Anaerolineales bacterium]